MFASQAEKLSQHLLLTVNIFLRDLFYHPSPLVVIRCHSLLHLLSLVATWLSLPYLFVNDPIKLKIFSCGFINYSDSEDSKLEIIYIKVSPQFDCLFSINEKTPSIHDNENGFICFKHRGHANVTHGIIKPLYTTSMFLRRSKGWSLLRRRSVGRVQNEKCYFMHASAF